MKIERKNLLLLLPYTGAFLILLGVTKLYFFYSTFKINILNFIDLSEVIILSFETIITYIPTFTYVFTAAYLLDMLLAKIKLQTIRDYVNSKNDNIVLILIPFLMFLSIDYLIPNVFADTDILLMFVLLKITILVAIGIVSLRIITVIMNNNFNISGIYNAIVLASFFFVLSAFDGKIEALNILTKKKNEFCAFNYNETLVHTNDTTFYVGNTKNYIFLHNSRGYSMIYEMEKLENLTVISK